MKKLLIILLLLVSGLSFSQEKKEERTLDERVNIKLDSLSKVYNKKVCGHGWFSYRGVKETVIYYIEDGKRIKEVIKTEIVGVPKNEEE